VKAMLVGQCDDLLNGWVHRCGTSGITNLLEKPAPNFGYTNEKQNMLSQCACWDLGDDAGILGGPVFSQIINTNPPCLHPMNCGQ